MNGEETLSKLSSAPAPVIAYKHRFIIIIIIIIIMQRLTRHVSVIGMTNRRIWLRNVDEMA